MQASFNYLPHDKFLNWYKLKAIVDDKINVVEIWKIDLERI